MNTTYEPPQLTVFGKASDTILGMCMTGWDIDGLMNIQADECASVDELDV